MHVIIVFSINLIRLQLNVQGLKHKRVITLVSFRKYKLSVTFQPLFCFIGKNYEFYNQYDHKQTASNPPTPKAAALPPEAEYR